MFNSDKFNANTDFTNAETLKEYVNHYFKNVLGETGNDAEAYDLHTSVGIFNVPLITSDTMRERRMEIVNMPYGYGNTDNSVEDIVRLYDIEKLDFSHNVYARFEYALMNGYEAVSPTIAAVKRITPRWFNRYMKAITYWQSAKPADEDYRGIFYCATPECPESYRPEGILPHTYLGFTTYEGYQDFKEIGHRFDLLKKVFGVSHIGKRFKSNMLNPVAVYNWVCSNPKKDMVVRLIIHTTNPLAELNWITPLAKIIQS